MVMRQMLKVMKLSLLESQIITVLTLLRWLTLIQVLMSVSPTVVFFFQPILFQRSLSPALCPCWALVQHLAIAAEMRSDQSCSPALRWGFLLVLSCLFTCPYS